jgi:hypothetical protein
MGDSLNRLLLEKLAQLALEIPDFAKKAHPFFWECKWEWENIEPIETIKGWSTIGIPSETDIYNECHNRIRSLMRECESELPRIGHMSAESGRILVSVIWRENDNGTFEFDAHIRLIAVSVRK